MRDIKPRWMVAWVVGWAFTWGFLVAVTGVSDLNGSLETGFILFPFWPIALAWRLGLILGGMVR